MLIIGAGGFAKEILMILNEINIKENIAFYDDIPSNIDTILFNKYPIIKNTKSAIFFLKQNNHSFTIGLGNPLLRKRMYDKFIKLNGKYTSTISRNAIIGQLDTEILKGTNILAGAKISNSVSIGIGNLIYYNVILTHDVKTGKFVEFSPNAIVLGRTTIGDFSQIGSNATILPDITIGKNVVIGAGAIVTKNVPDNEIWIGNPARFYKKNKPLKL